MSFPPGAALNGQNMPPSPFGGKSCAGLLQSVPASPGGTSGGVPGGVLGGVLEPVSLRLPESPTVGMRPVRSELTSREWEVLDLLCERKTTDEVASDLFLSPETVRSHVKSIYRKLGVNSRDDAIARSDELRQVH